MSRFRIMPAAVGLVVAAAVAAPGLAATPEVTLKVQHFLPPVAPAHKDFLEPWAAKIAKESGGRIKAEIYPSMQLGGKPPQLFDQVRDGVVDVVWTLPGYTPGRFPKSEVFELPFVATNPIATNLAIQEFAKTNLMDEFKDVHPLLFHIHAGQLFHMVKKPIRTVADLKGLKIRTPNSTGTMFLEAVGVTPIGSAVPEVPQLLSKGVVDGVMLPFEVTISLKVHEMTKYVVGISGNQRTMSAMFLLAMNKAKYEGLPADLKKVIDDNSGSNLARVAGQIWIDTEKPGEKAARDRGNEFITLSPAETDKLRAAAQPAIDKWIAQMKGKGIDGAKLLTEARALVAKYTK